MRILTLLPLLALAACNVSHDQANDSTTMSFNQDIAENAIDDAGNTVDNVADDIGNDVDRTGDKIQNKVGDVNVKVDTNGDNDANQANATADTH